MTSPHTTPATPNAEAPVPRPPAAPQPAPAHNPPHHPDDLPTDLHRPHPVTLIISVIVFLCVLAGLFYLGYVPHKAAKEQAAAEAKELNAAPPVSVAAPKKSKPSQEVVLPADVRPNQETLIYPRTTGYLKKFYVDLQDKVTEGQLLAEIDTPEVDAQLEQARAALTQAKANTTKAESDLALAQRTLERYTQINGSSVTPQERDEKLAARDQAAAAVEQAKANTVAAEANVQRLVTLQGFEKIAAPFAGTITSRNFDVGALLTAGSTGRELFKLTQADKLRVFINMPQVSSSAVKPGQEATLTVRNYPGRTFKGAVARLAGAVDPASRTMPFELHFANPHGELFAGMYGEVRLAVPTDTPALIVPTSALVFNAGGTQVGLVKDGKAHFQKVALGRDFGTELEVITGLSEGDQVITNPGERLAEGADVQVFSPDAPKDKPKVAAAN